MKIAKSLTIRLDPHTHQKLKEKAVKNKTSIQKLIERFIDDYLKVGKK